MKNQRVWLFCHQWYKGMRMERLVDVSEGEMEELNFTPSPPDRANEWYVRTAWWRHPMSRSVVADDVRRHLTAWNTIMSDVLKHPFATVLLRVCSALLGAYLVSRFGWRV